MIFALFLYICVLMYKKVDGTTSFNAEEKRMKEPRKLPKYTWGDSSSVLRQYIVMDNRGRFGIAIADPVHHPNDLLVYPIDLLAEEKRKFPVFRCLVLQKRNILRYMAKHPSRKQSQRNANADHLERSRMAHA